jgi:hypothetical protein
VRRPQVTAALNLRPKGRKEQFNGHAAGEPRIGMGSVEEVNRYPFLSEGWFAEVRRLHEAYDNAVPPAAAIRMNLVITDTPFGGDLPIHMTAEGGQADWGEGHLEEADVTLILGYETAREIFVGGNPQAAIEAFMAGKITMQGDITKLVEMQTAQPGPGAPELARAMQQITE